MRKNGKIALVAVLCGTLVLALSAAPGPQSRDKQQLRSDLSGPQRTAPEFRSRLGEGLGKWLGLSPEQQARYDALRKAHLDQRQALIDDMRKLGDELRALRQDPQSDPRKADALVDRLEALRADRMKSIFRYEKDLEKLLTPEQRKKLDQLRSRDDRGRHYRGYGFSPFWSFGFGGFYRPWGLYSGFGLMHRGFFGHRFGRMHRFGRGFRRF